MDLSETRPNNREAVRLTGLSEKPEAEYAIDQEASLRHYIDLKKRLDAVNVQLFRTTREWPISEAIADFADQLKVKYKADDYHMFHVLGGSTLGRPALFFDFPAEDSVANFLDNLADKYLRDEQVREEIAV